MSTEEKEYSVNGSLLFREFLNLIRLGEVHEVRVVIPSVVVVQSGLAVMFLPGIGEFTRCRSLDDLSPRIIRGFLDHVA